MRHGGPFSDSPPVVKEGAGVLHDDVHRAAAGLGDFNRADNIPARRFIVRIFTAEKRRIGLIDINVAVPQFLGCDFLVRPWGNRN